MFGYQVLATAILIAWFQYISQTLSRLPEPIGWLSPVRLTSVGSRAFLVAIAKLWSSLPKHIVSAPTLQSFMRYSKTALLLQSLVDLVAASVTYTTVKNH